MKKLIFASLLVFASHFTQAQVFSFGIKGGVNTQIDKPKDIVVGSGGTPFNLGNLALNLVPISALERRFLFNPSSYSIPITRTIKLVLLMLSRP